MKLSGEKLQRAAGLLRQGAVETSLTLHPSILLATV